MNNLVKISNNIINYLLVTIVLILEVTVFYHAVEFRIPHTLIIITFLFLLPSFISKKFPLSKNLIKFIALVVILILIQGIFFGISLISMITYPVAVIFVPYMLYRIVGPKIFEYLVNVIYVTTILATVIWLVQNLYQPFDYLLQYLRLSSDIHLVQGNEEKTRVSLAFIYTITYWKNDIFGFEIYRNAGLYHEPGAFAYFLILAIGINTIIKNQFLNKKNIIMSVILLTTFSTAGYIAFFVILAFVVFRSRLNLSLKILAIPLFLVLSYVAFTQLEFMQDKIVAQYEAQIDDDTVFEGREGRIRRVRSAINLLLTSPLIGRGIISAARDYELGSIYYFTGAGFWRTLASYGIIFAPLIYYFYYKGIRRLCVVYSYDSRFSLFFFIAIAVGATSQGFFMDNITILFFINGLLANSVISKQNTNP